MGCLFHNCNTEKKNASNLKYPTIGGWGNNVYLYGDMLCQQQTMIEKYLLMWKNVQNKI